MEAATIYGCEMHESRKQILKKTCGAYNNPESRGCVWYHTMKLGTPAFVFSKACTLVEHLCFVAPGIGRNVAVDLRNCVSVIGFRISLCPLFYLMLLSDYFGAAIVGLCHL